MIVVDPWHWLTAEAGFPPLPAVRRNSIRVARFIEYAGGLEQMEGRSTLVECRRRLDRQPCLGFMFVVRNGEDALHVFCPVCRKDEFLIHNWQRTRWAEGLPRPVRVEEVPRQ